MTSPIVINMPARELLAGETKGPFVSRFQQLNGKNNVCKQISSLYKHSKCFIKERIHKTNSTSWKQLLSQIFSFILTIA